MYKIFLQIDSAKLVEIIRRELGTDSLHKTKLIFEGSLLFNIGLALFILGLVAYLLIFISNRRDLPNGMSTIMKSASYLISFTPNGKVWHHISAGLSLSAGASILFGYWIRESLEDDSLNFHANVLSIAGMFFAILTTSLTFWTLYQTKKMEHDAGHKIFDFRDWIKILSNELSKILVTYHDNKNRKNYYRVYIVTEHPFFGMMSYRSDPGTTSYFGHLNRLMHLNVNTSEGNNDANPNIDFEIICGDSQCITTFIGNYHKNRKDDKSKDDIEIFETSITPFVHTKIATRFEEIPKYPQFAVIGNVVFEFMIEASEPETRIKEAHVYRDKKKADLYIELFKLMKKGLRSTHSVAAST